MTKDFSSFGLPEKLMQALTRMNFTTPTPIQLEAIPVALAGRDILGSAQTGTGKTGAFGIPLIAKLMEDPFATALVMTPTRELASQVLAALQQMIPVQDIKVALLIGGDAMPKQFRQLQNKPRLIVGTPGRINDHLERGSLKLNKTKFLVLDETDRMLDMGFGIQIDTILKHVPEQGRQTMLFSATLPAGIVKISSKYLNNPQRISVGSTTTPAAKIKQELVQTSEADKYNHLLTQVNNRTGSIIIFVKTKYGADRLADRLSRAEHAADAIHGDLKQSRRERVIMDFRNKKQRILVATDVAARGLDIPHIEHVINYDLPQCPEDYIHRIGRTARAGAEGEAVNLLTPADNAKWRAIQRLMDPNASLPSHKEEGNSRGGRSSGGPRRSFGGGKPGADKPWQKKPFFKDNDRSSSAPRPERPKWDSAAPQQERAVSSERPAFDRNERNDRGSNASAGGAERKPWVKREGGDRGSSNAAGGERKPWVKREGGDRGSSNAAGGERKPWVKREGGDRGNSNAGGGERKVWGNKPRGEQGRDGAPRTEGRRFDSKPAGQDGAPKKHYGDRMKARPNKTAA